MSFRRRPTARDRNLADAIRRLPLGKYSVIIEPHDHHVFEKAEGMLVLFEGDKRILFYPVGT